jgi:membrane protease YdiL (CAAX protease family)
MLVNLLYALVPYMAVGLGLLAFHNAWAAILLYHGAIAAVVILSKRVVPFRQIIRGSGSALLIISAAIGAMGGALIYLLWPLLSVPPDINSYMQSIGLTNTSWPYFIAYYVLVNPILEEYYWRGFLGSSAKHPVINDFMFAGYHILVLAGKVGAWWLVLAFAVLGCGGWYWRQVSRISGGLLAATLSHMAGDITVILAIYWMTGAG